MVIYVSHYYLNHLALVALSNKEKRHTQSFQKHRPEFCFVLFFIASEYIIIHLLIYIFFSVCIIFYKYSKLMTRNMSQTLTLQDLIKLIIVVIFVCLLIYFRFCSFQWRFSSSTSSYLNEPHKFQELVLSCQPEAEEKNATKVKTR